MEPAEYRPDDEGPDAAPHKVTIAAMEPAEYRPDDGGMVLTSVPEFAPQWSRPSIGRMTSPPVPAPDDDPAAAMEPAEYRPDDMSMCPRPVMT